MKVLNLILILVFISNCTLNKVVKHHGVHNLKKKNGSVLIISIPDWGSSPFGEGFDRNEISNEINTFNNSLKSFANINGLKYVDVTEISRRAINEPNLIAVDNLHPSGIMYLEWAKKIFQVWID